MAFLWYAAAGQTAAVFLRKSFAGQLASLEPGFCNIHSPLAGTEISHLQVQHLGMRVKSDSQKDTRTHTHTHTNTDDHTHAHRGGSASVKCRPKRHPKALTTGTHTNVTGSRGGDAGARAGLTVIRQASIRRPVETRPAFLTAGSLRVGLAVQADA